MEIKARPEIRHGLRGSPGGGYVDFNQGFKRAEGFTPQLNIELRQSSKVVQLHTLNEPIARDILSGNMMPKYLGMERRGQGEFERRPESAPK